MVTSELMEGVPEDTGGVLDAYGQALGLVSWSHDVRAALRRLDPTQSRVLRLMYFERRTRDQVAAELKLSPAAVTTALAAGMQALALAVVATAD